MQQSLLFSLSPYVAAARMGAGQALRNRGALGSNLIVYVTLLIVWAAIFRITPVEELGLPGLTTGHLFAYFAVAESIIVGCPGLALFGQLIAEGRLSEGLSRPCSLVGFTLAWLMGQHFVTTLVLLGVGTIALPLLDAPTPLGLLAGDGALRGLGLALSMTFGIALMGMMTYALGTVEVLGSYSRPLSWMVSKSIYAFGGLFFPVAFFPPLMREVAMLTPFPSVIFVPGSLMLNPTRAGMLEGLLMQLFWLGVMGLVLAATHRWVVNKALNEDA